MAPDVFPQTLKTWIQRELDQGPGGRANVNHHLMSTYALPLRVYYLGTNSRWLGEPDDVIAGFFASRLAQDDFFDKWRVSGMRLRRWLMNAFSFYLMELRRLRRKHAHAAVVDEPLTFEGDPDAQVDRASVIAFVQQAMHQAQQQCEREGLDQHWRAFIRHNIDNVDFATIARELSVSEARAAVMSRTATRKFSRSLRDILIRDGVPEADVDCEIQSLLEGIGR